MFNLEVSIRFIHARFIRQLHWDSTWLNSVLSNRCSNLATGWTTEESIPALAGGYSLLRSFQTSSGIHPVGTGAIPVEVEPPEREAKHLSPSTVEVKIKCFKICTLHQIFFW